MGFGSSHAAIESTGPVRWINDSKATNVEATMAGVSGLDGQVWLLLGDRAKRVRTTQRSGSLSGAQWSSLWFGEAADDISTALEGLPLSRHTSLAAAVEWVDKLARGVLAVLSPACASFDGSNFSQRETFFKSLYKRAR